jgi:hypothetical protein
MRTLTHRLRTASLVPKRFVAGTPAARYADCSSLRAVKPASSLSLRSDIVVRDFSERRELCHSTAVSGLTIRKTLEGSKADAYATEF